MHHSPVLCAGGDAARDAAARHESALFVLAASAADAAGATIHIAAGATRVSSRQAGKGEGAGEGEGEGVGGLGAERPRWWFSSHQVRVPPGAKRTHGGKHHMAPGSAAPGGTQTAASTAHTYSPNTYRPST